MKGFESHPYIPNSVPEVQEEMLREIGLGSLEELHKNVPELLKLKNEMNLPKAFRSEYELKRHVERVLSKDTDCHRNLNFLGAGCWQHYVPAICDEINGCRYRRRGKDNIHIYQPGELGIQLQRIPVNLVGSGSNRHIRGLRFRLGRRGAGMLYPGR